MRLCPLWPIATGVATFKHYRKSTAQLTIARMITADPRTRFCSLPLPSPRALHTSVLAVSVGVAARGCQCVGTMGPLAEDARPRREYAGANVPDPETDGVLPGGGRLWT